MAQAIAPMALAALGVSGETFHEPFHANGRQRSMAVTDCSELNGLERHGSRVPAGLWARIVQRLLALDACIWHNWQIGAPVKRSLIAYDH